MTLHADTLVPDAISAFPFSESADFSDPRIEDDGECRVLLAPRHGEGRSEVRIRYSLSGPVGAPVIAVQGGISAGRHAAPRDAQPGWWDALAGPGRAIDTARFRLLSIEWLERADFAAAGACAPGVRAVGSEDQADAIAAVLDELGITRLHAFVGASYGAMVGLALAARHAGRVRRLIAIAGAHRAHPLSTAVRNLQREIVRLAARHGDVGAGLDLARRLAMTTYRGEREFAERCGAPPEFREGRYRFAEEDWLGAAGASFVRRFRPERFLDLSESIDLHAVAPEDVRVPTTLVGIASDRVVPLADLCELQRRCGAPATLHVIDSRYGHDAFLKETAQIAPLIADALDAKGA